MKSSLTLSLIILGWLGLAGLSQAQENQGATGNNLLRGRVTEASSRNPMIGASVVVKDASDSLLAVTVSGPDGNFQLKAPQVPEFKLEISFLGYETIQRSLKPEDNLDLGVLYFKEGSKLLGEVLVEGQVPVGEMKGDTTVFNAAAFKTRENAVAEDLIGKLPGITIQDGQVQAQGEQVQKVLVDGREFFGNDPSIALRNLPSDMIESVEILDQRSDQSRLTGIDDGNYAKTINIITKGNMRNSQFGRIYAGYGSNNHYALGGNINFFKGDKRISLIGLFNNINQQNFSSDDLLGVSGGLGGGGRRRGGPGAGGSSGFFVGQDNGIATTNSMGLNYSDKWGERINFTGSYFYNSTENTLFQSTNRETVVSADITQLYQELLSGSASNKNHRVSGRMEYDINEKNALIISPSFNYRDNTSLSDRDGLNLSAGLDPISAARSISDGETNGFNLSNNLTYRYKFDKQGRTLSADLFTAWNQRDQFTRLLSASRDYVRNSFDTLLQESNALSDGFNFRASMVYTEPINERSVASLSYRLGNNKSAADQKTFQMYNEQGLVVLDTALSNEFDNKFITQGAGIGYRYNFKGLNFNLGLDYQHTSMDNQNYFPHEADFSQDFKNVLPSLMISYKSASGTSLRLRYRTGTGEPGVNQLQNVINNENPLNLTVGNPALGQSFNNTLFLNLSRVNIEKSKTFFVFLMGSLTENYMGSSTLIASRDTLINQEVLLSRGGQLTQPVNLKGRWNSRLFLTYGTAVPVLKSQFNLNSSVSYSQTPGIINNRRNVNKNIDLRQGFTLSSNISKDLDFILSTSGTYSIVNSSLQTNLENNYYIQNSNIRMYYSPNNGKLFVSNNINNMLYQGLSEGLDQSVWLWNIEAGYRFLKNNKGELKLSVFDLLKNNNSITRTVSDVSVTDIYSNVLTRYALVSFTYIIGNFKKPENTEDNEIRRMRPGGGRSW